MEGKGPPEAFELLESKLPSLKGRRFYGTFRLTPEGEEYWACVAMTEGDDPAAMRLETGTIPGGWYVRRRVEDWENVVRDGKLPELLDELAGSNLSKLDRSRPSVEFYRSREELMIMLPVKGPPASKVEG